MENNKFTFGGNPLGLTEGEIRSIAINARGIKDTWPTKRKSNTFLMPSPKSKEGRKCNDRQQSLLQYKCLNAKELKMNLKTYCMLVRLICLHSKIS